MGAWRREPFPTRTAEPTGSAHWASVMPLSRAPRRGLVSLPSPPSFPPHLSTCSCVPAPCTCSASALFTCSPFLFSIAQLFPECSGPQIASPSCLSLRSSRSRFCTRVLFVLTARCKNGTTSLCLSFLTLKILLHEVVPQMKCCAWKVLTTLAHSSGPSSLPRW